MQSFGMRSVIIYILLQLKSTMRNNGRLSIHFMLFFRLYLCQQHSHVAIVAYSMLWLLKCVCVHDNNNLLQGIHIDSVIVYKPNPLGGRTDTCLLQCVACHYLFIFFLSSQNIYEWHRIHKQKQPYGIRWREDNDNIIIIIVVVVVVVAKAPLDCEKTKVGV